MKNNVLPAIGKEYTFSELSKPIFHEQDKNTQVWITVKYIDKVTKATQTSQYELILEKDSNWMIVK